MWRLNPDAPTKRILIANIKQEKMSYQHSFALTENYAVIFESPFHFSIYEMLMGYGIDTALKNDVNATTKVHVVHLADGKVQSIDSKMFAFILHFGNTFEKDGKIYIDAPAQENPNINQFTTLSYKNLTESKILDRKIGVNFSRFEIDLAKETVSIETLIPSENGSFDLPQVNPLYRGNPDFCFSYTTNFFSGTEFEGYSMPVVKYDSCKKEIVGTWGH